MHKYKAGDLVRYCHSYLYSYYGIGIIVAIDLQDTLGPAYGVYWTKIGLNWHYEEYLSNLLAQSKEKKGNINA